MNKGSLNEKFTVLCLTFIMAFAALGSISANATTSPKGTQIQIEYLENGDYTETVINDELPDNVVISPFATTKTITKSKTTYYKNSAGTVLWSVTIKGTFTYNGSTSKCTSCSHSTTAPSSAWSIKVLRTVNQVILLPQGPLLLKQLLPEQRTFQCQLQLNVVLTVLYLNFYYL